MSPKERSQTVLLTHNIPRFRILDAERCENLAGLAFVRKSFPHTMARSACVTVLLLTSLALSAALGPAKTCSTGVAEEDPTAV